MLVKSTAHCTAVATAFDMSTGGIQNGVTHRSKESENQAKLSSASQNGASSSENPPSPSSNWTLMVVFLSLLVDLLGFTVILPLIPSMLEYYNNNDQVMPVPVLCLVHPAPNPRNGVCVVIMVTDPCRNGLVSVSARVTCT